MTTQEKIAEIIKDQYNDFKGNKRLYLKHIHEQMRSIEKPLKWRQYIIMFFGGEVKREKLITDEKYLEFLEKAKKENPKPPPYIIPTEFYTQPKV